jgi:hypothetical protein
MDMHHSEDQIELTKPMLRASHLARRYRVDPRTITRWQKSGVLPPPDLRINGLPYWDESTIETNEREKLSARATAQPVSSAA